MIKLIKVKESDMDFLLNLRKITMTKYLEGSGVFLTKEEHLARVITDYDNSNIIFCDDLKIGMIKYLIGEKFIEIIQFQILPEFQGKGYGGEVLNIIFGLSKELNKKIFLKVLKNNPAQNLYKKNGFSLVGEDESEFFMERKI